MKNLSALLLVSIILLAAGCAAGGAGQTGAVGGARPTPSAAPAASAPAAPTAAPGLALTSTVATLSVGKVRELLAGANPPVVFDTRDREVYDSGHVPGARSLPYDELETRLAEVPKDRPVVLYCTGAT